jgi:hypothetical protein
VQVDLAVSLTLHVQEEMGHLDLQHLSEQLLLVVAVVVAAKMRQVYLKVSYVTLQASKEEMVRPLEAVVEHLITTMRTTPVRQELQQTKHLTQPIFLHKLVIQAAITTKVDPV